MSRKIRKQDLITLSKFTKVGDKLELDSPIIFTDLKELIKKCKEYEDSNIGVFLDIPMRLEEFHIKIGKEFAGEFGYDSDFQKKLLSENDETMYAMMGVVILDWYIPKEFYIKYGAYNRELKVEDKYNFGIKLLSSNQHVCKIEKEK